MAPVAISNGVATRRPRLILCADGGGSKVMVVIRSEDGLEVRGTGGPCNVQSVGHVPAADRILEATYRALAQLPHSHLPANFAFPTLSAAPLAPNVGVRSNAATPNASGANTPTRVRPSPIPEPLFEYCWIALAGMTTESDGTAFMPYVSTVLCTPPEKLSLTNDVNLLASPAVHLSGINHVIAVVVGTGTVGRTIRMQTPGTLPPSPPLEGADQDVKSAAIRRQSIAKGKAIGQGLPLQDVGVSRGWGYMLCDEGSAFWIGRLAIRFLLFQWDREHSTGIYTAPTPPKLPLYNDLMEYFDIDDPTELIAIVALMGDFVAGLNIGEASSKRNAYLAGAARHVFKWAFPQESGQAIETDDEKASHKAALELANSAITSVVQLADDSLGDRTVVDASSTALCLGGGLMNSAGYRALLLDGLKARGVEFKNVLLVDDAAGEGAKAVAAVAF